MSSQPHPQSLPRPYPGRFAYPQPQRLDSRPAQSPQYPDMKPQSRPMPPPAMNSDPYRSSSMARMGGPPMYQPSPNSFNHTSAIASRQQPYNAGATKTALGRPVPERHGNERAMSMTSYTTEQNHSNTTNAGRAIPSRRPPSRSGQQPPTAQYEPQPAHAPSVNGKPRPPSDGSSRSVSMASTVLPDRTTSLQSHGTQQSSGQTTLVASNSRRSKVPMVYPALLSRVADGFRERIVLGERQKNGLSYQNSFSGAEAVDLIGQIIKTNDRNLALLLGRALDAQKFFHDVTYDHRLRDAPGELYQFKETMGEEAPSSEVDGVFTLLSEC